MSISKLTGKWYLRKRFFGGYDVYVEVERTFYPFSKSYRKIRADEEGKIYNLNKN